MDSIASLNSLLPLLGKMDTAHVLAFAGGFVPALLWLFFWLAEDRKHPEPKRLILLSFAVGILVVPLALFLERLEANFLFSPASLEDVMRNTPALAIIALFFFALIEEVCKWVAAYAAALWSKEVDEPIDYMIYLIAAALGFAAYETALFLFTPMGEGRLSSGLIMSNLRAIGAMLLHVVSSSLVGLTLAFGFYKRRTTRVWLMLLGLFSATALHAIFNLAIMTSTKESALAAFVGVWIAIIVLLLMFERAKKVHPTLN